MSAVTMIRPLEQADWGARYPDTPRGVRDCAVRARVGSDPRDSYICTRPIGHDGPHVAHGGEHRALAWWEGIQA